MGVATRQTTARQRADAQRSRHRPASHAAAGHETSSIDRLQRTVGNRAIVRLLDSRPRVPSQRIQRQANSDKPTKGATANAPKSEYRWEPSGASKVPGQELTAVTTYGNTVPTAKLQLVERDVETVSELAAAALREDTKAVHIVGSGLEYFKNHETSQQIRRDFFVMLEETVKNQKTSSGKLTDTFGAKLRTYGSIWKNPLSQGTWMIGKTDEPKIEYEATYSRLAKDRWKVDWRSKWKTVDDFNFVPGSDKSLTYNLFAWTFGKAWHNAAGGKEHVPVFLEWEESGSFVIQPNLPTVTTYGTTPIPGK